MLAAAPLRQHLYSCARKASKLSTSPNSRLPLEEVAEVFEQFLLSQYLYCCTSKASNLVQQVPSSSELSVSAGAIATAGLCKRLLSAAHHLARLLTTCARKLLQQVRCTALPVAQHTSACVSIRQHTCQQSRGSCGSRSDVRPCLLQRLCVSICTLVLGKQVN